MPKYLIKLYPLEPYFFGGDRIFEFGDHNKHYYIRSLDVPSQTTLFGTLRFMMIQNPEYVVDFKTRYNQYQSERKKGVFKREFHGFALNRPDIKFDKIKGISPLYLVDQDDHFYIPSPLNHKTDTKKDLQIYQPLKCTDTIITDKGTRILPGGYIAKDGLTQGWLRLCDKTIHTDLVISSIQVGINKNNSMNAYFKRENKILKSGFAFAFFADIETELYQNIVYMGQNKSSFRVNWKEMEEPNIPTDLLDNDMLYAQSDIYFPGDLNQLYTMCNFVCTQMRNHRVFEVNNLDRRGSKAIKLIQAGSVFQTERMEEFIKEIDNNHAKIAGFNRLIWREQ